MARKIEKIEFHNSREKQHNSWARQAAEALEVDLDDDMLLGKTNVTIPVTDHLFKYSLCLFNSAHMQTVKCVIYARR